MSVHTWGMRQQYVSSDWTPLYSHLPSGTSLILFEGEYLVATLDPKLVDGKYRVPIFKKDQTYVVWVGGDKVRYFNPDDLPDRIKVALGIIFNSPHAVDLNKKDMTDMDLSKGVLQNDLYKSDLFGEEYEDIGWQYNRYYYIVVLEPDEYKGLKDLGSARMPKTPEEAKKEEASKKKK